MDCPAGKVCFLTGEDARKELRSIKKELRSMKQYKKSKHHLKNRKECRVYFCNLCGMWHLTSKPALTPEQLFLKQTNIRRL